MELGAGRRRSSSAPHHPYTEALLSAVPTIDGAERRADPARGRDPEPRRTRRPAASSTPAARASSATSARTRSRALEEVEPGHFWRCHYPVEELRELQQTPPGDRVARRSGGAHEDPRRGPRRGRRAPEVEELELARARAGRGARAAPRERGLPLRPERDRRHGDRRAAPRCSATRAPASSRRSAPGVTRVAPGDARRALLGALLRALRGVPARPAAPLRGGLARDGRRAGCSTARPRLSRDGEPVYHYSFLSTFADHAVVPERSLRPDPATTCRSTSRRSSAARSTTGIGAVWRTAGVRPGERVAVIGCGGVGLCALLGAVAVGAEPVVAVDVDAGQARGARSRSARPHACRWAGDAEATAERGASTRQRRRRRLRDRGDRAARGDARAPSSRRGPRGAAVLIGIPRADAVLHAARRSRSRGWSGACSARSTARRGPSATSPRSLDLYRRGRLPLDRLISHRLPLDEVARGVRAAARRRGAAGRARPPEGAA